MAVAAAAPTVRVATRPARSTVVAAAVGAALVVAFVLLRLALTTSVGGFVVAGDSFADPARVPAELPVAHGNGYDGQFLYRFAREPWTGQEVDDGIRLDWPGYRQQRIATAGLAWLLAWLPGVSTPLALILVNILALAAAACYGTRLAADAERHPAWGLVLAFPACMPISLGRDLTEPLAWAGVLAGIYYWRHGRWPAAAAALTVAVLARETSLLVVVGLLAATALRGPHRAARLGWLAVPLAAVAAWQLRLWAVWGTLPARTGANNSLGDQPVLGVLDTVFDGFTSLTGSFTDSAAVGLSWHLERLAILAAFAVAAALLLTRRSRVTQGEAISWLLGVALALWLGAWSYDVQFLRAAYEGLALSVLVALFARGRAATLVLALSGTMAAAVAAVYTLAV